jgi:hypothetical protein
MDADDCDGQMRKAKGHARLPLEAATPSSDKVGLSPEGRGLST